MKMYNVKEIADMLSTNPETVRRWIRGGRLGADQESRKGGNMISEEELQSFLDKNPKYASLAGQSLGQRGSFAGKAKEKKTGKKEENAVIETPAVENVAAVNAEADNLAKENAAAENAAVDILAEKNTSADNLSINDTETENSGTDNLRTDNPATENSGTENSAAKGTAEESVRTQFAQMRERLFAAGGPSQAQSPIWDSLSEKEMLLKIKEHAVHHLMEEIGILETEMKELMVSLEKTQE